MLLASLLLIQTALPIPDPVTRVQLRRLEPNEQTLSSILRFAHKHPWTKHRESSKVLVTEDTDDSLPDSASSFLETSLVNHKNTQYVGDVQIGTSDPPQNLGLIFDTGSANMWVYGSNCSSSVCQMHNTYNHERSSSFRANGTSMYIKYGSGSILGTLSVDSLSFGNIAIPDQKFGEVHKTKGDAFMWGKYDGIIGLAFPALAIDGCTPVFDNLMQKQLINAHYFSFYFSKEAGGPGAVFMLGGADASYQASPFIFHDVVTSSYWEISMQDIMINGQPQGFCRDQLCKVAIDTGTSLITGPSDAIDVMASLIQVDPDCDNPGLPSIDFVMSGTCYPMISEDYILKFQSGEQTKCMAGFRPLNIPPPRGPIWIMGDVFLRVYYTVFDRSGPNGPRVGLAKAKHANDVSALTPHPVAPARLTEESNPSFGSMQAEEMQMMGHDQDSSTNVWGSWWN